MTFESALRLCGILVGFAFFLQSLEHLHRPRDGRAFFAARAFTSLWLMSGIFAPVAAAVLFIFGIESLRKFDGPYNGGSDRMGLLVLWTVLIGELATWPLVREVAFGYLALQLVLSYFMAGLVKIRDPQWRNGEAMARIFRASIYPVSDSRRAWGDRPGLMFALGWGTLAFELLFPLALIRPESLLVALGLAFTFHIANAFILGLNRFVWTWLAAFPALIWFQAKMMGLV
ncbi:MAG: HTTM domain-containing protein [Bdellovibrionaceae bacterium]|nr:HTTM domain-containing protein [Pseudobdellovibrionaceae bacterium]